MATPKIAPRHQPHDIRFAIAMPPNTMIKMMATGVSHARILVCSEIQIIQGYDRNTGWGSAKDQIRGEFSETYPGCLGLEFIVVYTGSLGLPEGIHHRLQSTLSGQSRLAASWKRISTAIDSLPPREQAACISKSAFSEFVAITLSRCGSYSGLQYFLRPARCSGSTASINASKAAFAS